MNTAADVANYEIQLAIVLFCYIGYIVAINHMVKSDGALLDTVKDNLAKVVETIEQVKVASNSIVDEVTVVRELTEENKNDASAVVDSMEEMVTKSDLLGQKIDSSMEMTKDIDTQVTEVAGLIENIVELSEQSAVQADSSSKELKNVVESTRAMAKLSEEVETILSELRNQFTKVKQETGTMQSVNSNVETIAEESKQLGDKIQVVDSAMKNVEASNKNMVDNMEQVQEIMVDMRESVVESEKTTITMMSKCEETARDIGNIEKIVGKLVEELGVGGFMSVKDIEPGMSVKFIELGTKEKLKTQVGSVFNEKILIEATAQTESYFKNSKKSKYEVQIMVNNAMYTWQNVEVGKVTVNGNSYYQLRAEGNPKVANRRMHPRLPMSQSCDIVLKALDRSFRGKMVNISAGGYAFACNAPEFADCVGSKVEIKIHSAETIFANALSAKVIRSTPDQGRYIVGCRLPEDNLEIQQYVEKRMK